MILKIKSLRNTQVFKTLKIQSQTTYSPPPPPAPPTKTWASNIVWSVSVLDRTSPSKILATGSTSRIQPLPQDYFLGPEKGVHEEKDPGVVISNRLTWDSAFQTFAPDYSKSKREGFQMPISPTSDLHYKSNSHP